MKKFFLELAVLVILAVLLIVNVKAAPVWLAVTNIVLCSAAVICTYVAKQLPDEESAENEVDA